MNRDITASTVLCALIGNPVGHSLSPEIHNAAFARLGLDFAYAAFCVTDLPAAIAGIRALGLRGASVTIPHKVAAAALLDEVEETAGKIGAINTIVNSGGRLRGYNTDGAGALKALRDAGCDPAGRSVLVLGSGGAARAIAFTLADQAAPGRLAIAGVVSGELSGLCADIRAKTAAGPVPVAMDSGGFEAEVARADIVINCTPIGMHPNENDTPVPAHMLGPRHTIFDIVYNPLATRLLAEAEARGARTIRGLEMFLNQAVLQFELWTGQEAPAEVMRAVLVKKFSSPGDKR